MYVRHDSSLCAFRPSDKLYSSNLQVDVAKCSVNGVHQIPQWYVRSIVTNVLKIIQSGVGTRRIVLKSVGTIQSLETRNRFVESVECLPDEPDTIDHGVVKPEHWVNWGREEVVHLCADGEMAGGVESEIAFSVAAIDFLVEEEESLLCDDTDDVAGVEPGLEDICGDIATEAARVVSQTGNLCDSVHCWRVRSEIGDHAEKMLARAQKLGDKHHLGGRIWTAWKPRVLT